MKKRTLLGLLAAGAVGWTVWQNLSVGMSRYEVASSRLPATFDGYKVLQLSDFHGASFPDGNRSLIAKIKAENPDIIAITGDFVDSRRQETASALALAEQLVQLAPTYYVTGNHEARLTTLFPQLSAQLSALGVQVLRNETVKLKQDGAQIELVGVDDPNFTGGTADQVLSQQLAELGQTADFRLLLSHRPEAFTTYVRQEVDLVLTGHVHGGQVRIPFVGGVIGPNQGWLPTYDAGRYQDGTTQMIVSRGLGNSIVPVRINNQPELVVVTLKTKSTNK